MSDAHHRLPHQHETPWISPAPCSNADRQMRVREITKPPLPTPRTCERSIGERCRHPRAPLESIPPPPQSSPFQLPDVGWWPYLDERREAVSLTGPAIVACPFSPAHNSWYITCPWVWCVVYSCVEARDKSSPCRPTTSQPGTSTSEMQKLFGSGNWKSPRISPERGFALGLTGISLEKR